MSKGTFPALEADEADKNKTKCKMYSQDTLQLAKHFTNIDLNRNEIRPRSLGSPIRTCNSVSNDGCDILDSPDMIRRHGTCGTKCLDTTNTRPKPLSLDAFPSSEVIAGCLGQNCTITCTSTGYKSILQQFSCFLEDFISQGS